MKPKNEKLKKQILNTTTQIIVNNGIGAVSTVQVAKKVGTTQSNIYSYFTNKQGLLLATFEYNQFKLIDMMMSLPSSKLSSTNQIKQFIAGFIQLSLEDSTPIRAVLAYRQQIELRPLLPSIEDNLFFKDLFIKFESFQKKGIIKPLNAQFLAENIFSIIANYLITVNLHEFTTDDVKPGDVAKLINDFLLI